MSQFFNVDTYEQATPVRERSTYQSAYYEAHKADFIAKGKARHRRTYQSQRVKPIMTPEQRREANRLSCRQSRSRAKQRQEVSTNNTV